nr:unnamed protein product [Digitaria exilis]
MAAASSSSSAASGFFSVHAVLLALLVIAAFLFVSGEASGAAHKVVDPEWHPATATWYGSAEGDGSDGGACGYGTLVDVVPMKARVGAVSPVLFKSGEGCGACYKVRCLDHGICSRRAVTVIVTDECPGGVCGGGRTHFDLSGAATACRYGGKNIAFRVNEGSTSFWLSLLVEFEDGDGDIGSMQLKQANSAQWQDMQHIWGATWSLTPGPLVGPFSVRLTTLTGNQTLTAQDVIPKNWAPKATYTSRLNFA